MSYTPLILGNTFIERFGASEGITHMKLQKLVYCSHGWWLVFQDGPVVNEKPQVWKFGPVFNSMYHTLSLYGNEPIKKAHSASPFSPPKILPHEEDAQVSQLIDWVWERYGHLSGTALSDLTHKPGTAWYKLAKPHNFRIPFDIPIPDEEVKAEFKKIYEEEGAAA
jgi:uncharacterized phage-associated protein